MFQAWGRAFAQGEKYRGTCVFKELQSWLRRGSSVARTMRESQDSLPGYCGLSHEAGRLSFLPQTESQ